MKVMLLEAQAGSAKAEADLRIAAAEAASLASKVRYWLELHTHMQELCTAHHLSKVVHRTAKCSLSSKARLLLVARVLMALKVW